MCLQFYGPNGSITSIPTTCSGAGRELSIGCNLIPIGCNLSAFSSVSSKWYCLSVSLELISRYASSDIKIKAELCCHWNRMQIAIEYINIGTESVIRPRETTDPHLFRNKKLATLLFLCILSRPAAPGSHPFF